MRTEYRIVQGKTYSLFGESASTRQYYDTVKRLTDFLLTQCPDTHKLLIHLQKAGKSSFPRRRTKDQDPALISFIKKKVRDSLFIFTKNVGRHLRSLPLTKRFDETLRTKEEQYHRAMVEIELTNRIYGKAFRSSEYRFALLPHCLRDFRPHCCSEPGEVEAICKGCTEECFIHLGSLLLKKHGIHPFISVEIDQETLFRRLKMRHPDIGALGIACIPELVRGMRLCVSLGIPAVGIPLDANRCARWMKQAHESSFNLEELEDLLNCQPGGGS